MLSTVDSCRQGTAPDAHFMGLALAQAHEAALAGEVPVGAVLVHAGEVVAIAHNAPISRCDPTAHAEVLALRQAASRAANYRLPGTTLYVTVEPCCMCAGALLHARVGRLVFGCREPKTGAVGAAVELAAANHTIAVAGGVRADEARQLMQTFFQLRRGA